MRRCFSTASGTPRRVLCSLNDLRASKGAAMKFPLSVAAPSSQLVSPSSSTEISSQQQKPHRQRRAARGGRTGFVFFCEQSQAPRAFVNSCPHALLELDLEDSDFFCDGFLQCKAHGAFFDPQTGICLQGPAAARRGRLEKQLGALTELAVGVEDDEVILEPRLTDTSDSPSPSPFIQSKSDQEWLDYRATRQQELATVLAGRQDDVQRMQEELHAKTMARMRQYAQTKVQSNSKPTTTNQS